MMRVTLPAHELRAVCVEAECDPRTVLRVLRGECVRPLTAARIQRVLDRRGHGAAKPPADEPAAEVA